MNSKQHKQGKKVNKPGRPSQAKNQHLVRGIVKEPLQ